MTSLKQAARADMRGWERVPDEGAKSFQSPSVPDESNTPGRSPNMLAPMPPGVTSGDGLQRQFYGGGLVPMYRILPTGGTR